MRKVYTVHLYSKLRTATMLKKISPKILHELKFTEILYGKMLSVSEQGCKLNAPLGL
jgi:hypothetical protein